MMVSLDGFFEGPHRELDWHRVDTEFNQYALELLDSVDLLVFGRVTYELMASYWPTEYATTDDPLIASRMNGLPKLVFSRTLKTSEWTNVRFAGSDPAGEIAGLKQEPGKDMAIFGSSDLALSLIQQRLIDEFRIFVNPVILGSGKRLFQGISGKLVLKLIRTRTFNSGNVLLCYEPDAEVANIGS
jgi:dihydrofolate reductase